MRIDNLIWLPQTIDKPAEKHQVTGREVEQVFWMHRVSDSSPEAVGDEMRVYMPSTVKPMEDAI